MAAEGIEAGQKRSVGKNGKRFDLVDTIRGLAVVTMIAFHFLYDWYDIFLGDGGWYWTLPVRIWQQCICWTFILVSGFVWEWGRKKNLQRGILLNVLGCGISAVMWLFMPEQAIWFGILNFYGCAVLLTIPLEKLLKRVPYPAGLLLSLALFFLTRDLQLGFLGPAGHPLAAVPSFLYSWKPMTILGFPFPGFYSTDYYPVFPWYFLFLCGFWMQRAFRMRGEKAGRMAGRAGAEGTVGADPETGADRAAAAVGGSAADPDPVGSSLTRIAYLRVPVLTAAGRHSLLIYLVHQPVCFVLAAVLTKLQGMIL